MVRIAGVRTVVDPEWTFRLLPEALTELGVEPRGVLHVGAHQGEEVPTYLACGFTAITLVEPDPGNCAVIRAQEWAPRVRIFGVACGAEPLAAAPFYRTTANTVFSSLTPNLRVGETEAVEVPVVLTSALQDGANVLVVDTQGTEMQVLEGADPSRLDLIIVETQTRHPTSHGAYHPDLMAWADEHGWVPRIKWQRHRQWSDLLLTPA
jgi:FkbM family methyltransferase